ncbi:MAG: insulinase family protein, partial [Nitrospinae bacterium]|nr:insulinase family protein [Nitrospinota bacterium]
MNGLPVVKFILVLFLFSFLSSAEAAERENKTLVLDNGLAAWLIYDPDVHRSAASLSVGTGQLYDPQEKMGLAHYLEHMLFLGTKKYPDVEDFKKFLNENSGGSNAYTAKALTNYFFEVSHGAFDGALDRFSQFFKAPLFDKKYAAREVNAVSSEHDKNMRSDGWRGSYVHDLTAEEGHPVRNFGTGNKDTLSGDNRAVLLDFYKKYYAAPNMKLVILSNRPLSEQVALARKYFGGIPSRSVTLPTIDPDFRKPLRDHYRLLKIKTIKDVRSLGVSFPTIMLKNHLESKPAALIGSVIGHEGKGSLLSKLKEEGLALGLSAGGGYSHPNINEFSVSVSLTQKGLKEYERILELIFAYIRMLKDEGSQRYTYDEEATMAEIDFKWKDPDEGAGFVSSRSALMHDYKLEDVETLPFLFKKYEPEAHRAILDTLTPENALVTLKNNSVATDRTEKFYGTEYSLTQVGGASFERLKNPPEVTGMFYPARNDFIPYGLTLVEEEPHLVWDDPMGKVWFQFDNRFKQPKAFLQLRIETPRVYDTVEHTMLAQLYDAALSEGLNELVYPIRLAGLSYSLGVQKKGIVFSIGGYSERIADLLPLVARNLLEIKIDQEKFENLKEAMVRGLQNAKLGKAYARGGYYSRQLWMTKQYNEEEKLEALKPLTLDQVKAFAKILFERVYITGMAHGNWTDAKVRQSIRTLLDNIKSNPLPKEDRFEQEVEVLDDGERIVFSRQVKDNNNSLIYALQIGEKSMDLQAKSSLIASIIESDFYTQMRTNQQLGYIVASFKQRVEDRLFMKFLIQ